jgi:Uma2 family endonuclease
LSASAVENERGSVEARRRHTIDDLMAWPGDERVELINGDIVQRPMTRFEHGLAQSALSDEIQVFKRRGGPDGWWIVTEISVQYSEHQCPSHDLAGWRKARVPQRPSGVMTLAPDWVCEILSPGHERKDLIHHLMLLQRAGVPHYWIVSPDDRTLIAYALDAGGYPVIFSADYPLGTVPGRVRVPPFDAVELDLGYVFGSPG